MTEQELREKIAKRIARSSCEVCGSCGANVSTDSPDVVANTIFALIKGALPELAKEAGYILRGKLVMQKSDSTEEAELAQWARDSGYRKLAKDQSLPLVDGTFEDFSMCNHPFHFHDGYDEAQQIMITPKDGAVWMKVKLEVIKK